MDLLKRVRAFVFVDTGLFFSVVLVMFAALVLTFFIDWRGPVDDLDAAQRVHAEGCFLAERSLGDSIFQYRPDCRDVLSRRPAGMTVE